MQKLEPGVTVGLGVTVSSSGGSDFCFLSPITSMQKLEPGVTVLGTHVVEME